MTRRAWRPDYDLVHPYGKSVGADHAHRNHRPNQYREKEEREQFLPPGIVRCDSVLGVGAV